MGGLGFRDITSFNKSALAKQLWRILKHIEYLVSQILRAKYFRNERLLEAKTGQKSSYLWRSLIAFVALIKEGMLWRLGNGVKTRRWGDKWLPSPSSFLVQSRLQVLDKDDHVNSLTDFTTGDWNRELVF